MNLLLDSYPLEMRQMGRFINIDLINILKKGHMKYNKRFFQKKLLFHHLYKIMKLKI